MSSIKSRLMKPTNLEFHETAYAIDREIWHFIKHEYKNKSKDANGNIPLRYWQTHAAPLHNECWKLIREITYANSIYPMNEEELRERVLHQQNAIGCCQNIMQMIRLTLNELPNVDANKLGTASELLAREADLLRAWKRSSRVIGNK